MLSGAVERSADGRAIADDKHRRARRGAACRRDASAPGETLFASIRRDRIAVRRPRAVTLRRDVPNSVTGEVHTIENQGSYVKVTIDLGDGEEFVANVLDEDYFLDPIDIGDRAVATGRAGDVRLLEDRASAQSVPMAQPSTVAA